MQKIILAVLISLFFGGCSGKVKTNPLPEQNKIIVPNYEITLDNNVNREEFIDFEKELIKMFSVKKIDEDNPITIWDIGKKRGHQ